MNEPISKEGLVLKLQADIASEIKAVGWANPTTIFKLKEAVIAAKRERGIKIRRCKCCGQEIEE